MFRIESAHSIVFTLKKKKKQTYSNLNLWRVCHVCVACKDELRRLKVFAGHIGKIITCQKKVKKKQTRHCLTVSLTASSTKGERTCKYKGRTLEQMGTSGHC